MSTSVLNYNKVTPYPFQSVAENVLIVTFFFLIPYEENNKKL